jgi:hypothetical protein
MFFASGKNYSSTIEPVKFLNRSTPFDKHEKGYYNTYMSGKIELEGA